MPSDKQDQVEKKTGKERFSHGPKKFSQDLLSFWQWAYSDIEVNILRGILAEYIVSLAAGCEQTTRVEWNAYDLITPEGIKIEVKSSSYWQSWYQEKHSDIRFDIAQTQSWDASTNEYSEGKQRHADIYVFCVLAHKDKNTLDSLNLEQWEFYVLPTQALDKLEKPSSNKLEKPPSKQKTIGLNALKNKLDDDLEQCKIDKLETAIHDTIRKIVSKN